MAASLHSAQVGIEFLSVPFSTQKFLLLKEGKIHCHSLVIKAGGLELGKPGKEQGLIFHLPLSATPQTIKHS